MSVLAVAAAGGHLLELHRLLPRMRSLSGPVTWVTFDNAQARSLLAGEDVHFVRYAATHDAVTTVRYLAPAARIVRRRRFDAVVSTGSSVAVPFLTLSRAMGIPTHYVESATRIDGPSLTGRILQRVPAIRLYTQDRRWEGGRWHYRGSVFDGFAAEEVAPGGEAPVGRIVVSVGSARDYGFRRLLERLLEILPSGVDVLWQTGATDVTGLGIDAHPALPFDELADAQRAADVVVIHAGIGSSMTALEAGRLPVIVPRRAGHGEHVDDHQTENAALLAERGLAIAREVDELTFDDLRRAAARRVTVAGQPPVFELDP